MKLFNIKNIDKFFQLVNSSKGNIYITSVEGDRFNLKSNLSKYIAFTELLTTNNIGELNLEIELEEDKIPFIEFMMNGDK